MTSFPRLPFACAVAFVGMVASTAHAAPPPAPPPPPAPSAPPPAPLPPPAPPVSPGQSVTVLGGYTCDLGDYVSVDPDDAHTTADLVCHALATHHATPGAYDVRIGKLGSKILLVLTDRASGDDRRLFLDGIEEAPVAADRLAKALVEHTTLEQTQTADNTVNGSSAVERRRVQVSWFLGGSIVEGLGLTSSPSAGVEGDVEFRLQRLSLLLQLRAGGIGSASDVTSYASADVGARYYFTDDDVAPFAGGGLSFANFSVSQSGGEGYSGSGPAAYGEVGVGFLRSSFVGAIVSVRADVPMFSLNQNSFAFDSGLETTNSRFVIPLSLNVGLRLH